MCDCITTNSKLIKSAIENEPEIVNVEYVLINYTWPKDRKVVIIADVSFISRLKNGKTVEKTKQYSIFCTYCPFCGKQYE